MKKTAAEQIKELAKKLNLKAEEIRERTQGVEVGGTNNGKHNK